MRCQSPKHPSGRLLLIVLLATGAAPLYAGQVEEAVEERVDVQEEAQRSQEQIDELANETETMVQQYRDVLRRIDNAESYNEQLSKQVARQEEKLASFQKQFEDIEETQRNIVPLMSRMLDVLDEMIQVDTPFLPRERQARLTALQDMMSRPDVTLPDKFRRIMEAYQIEMDYGRNIEAYEGELERDNGETLTVQFLRVGRLGLYYQTLDGSESGYWNKQTNSWQVLSDDYNPPIAKGLEIARKEAAPDFFRIPVPAPEAVE